VTAVVPARNAEALLPACLDSLRESGVARIVVVDGRSSDGSREVAERYGATVVSDEGRGLPWARALGVATATTPLVLLVDADVVFPEGALDRLLAEYDAGGYAALQAGLESVSGPGYWGRALAYHHRTGRSRHWFGLVATLCDREEIRRLGFDDAFRSGEDIELRWRMRDAGLHIGVSRSVVVEHRFAGDDFAFAMDQFSMDGFGLGRMMRKHRWRGLRLAALPAAAAARGVALSIVHRQPAWIPYFTVFAVAETTCRALGGPVVDRLGSVATVRITTAAGVAGMVLFILGGPPLLVLLGVVLWAIGVSMGFPLGTSAAARSGPGSAARVSVVTSLGYLANLAGPPVVGFLSQAVGLLGALWLLAAFFVVAFLVAGALATPRRPAAAA